MDKVTVTVRLIKSFEFANVKQLVLPEVSVGITTEEFQEMIKQKILSSPGFAPFHKVHFDTLKIYTQAHGYKPNNLTINFDDDDKLILQPHKTLKEQSVEEETELSFFNKADYINFKNKPELKW